MIELNEIYTVKTKPRKCPNCGSRKVAAVQRGTFRYSDLHGQGGDERGIILRPDDFAGPLPSWECRYCGMEIHKEASSEVMSLFQ